MSDVHHLALCEAGKLVLRPGHLYRFYEAPNCEECSSLAAESEARP